MKGMRVVPLLTRGVNERARVVFALVATAVEAIIGIVFQREDDGVTGGDDSLERKQ